VFQSISAVSYRALLVTESFFTAPSSVNYTSEYSHIRPYAEFLRTRVASNDLEHLDALTCLEAYASPLQSSYGDVLVVTDEPLKPAGLDQSSGAPDDRFYSWICGDNVGGRNKPCSFYLDEYRNEVSLWKPFGDFDTGAIAKYCYAERVPEKCRLSMSVPIVGLVTALSFLKVVLLIWTLFQLDRGGAPILTLGDAISSFLCVAETETRGMCLASKYDLRGRNTTWPLAPKVFTGKRESWFRAVSKTRWVLCILL
jgi:hypothetical protein